MRKIIHSDGNAFYASIEQVYQPKLRGKAMAVGGSEESRHGIILAKSEQAKKFGVKTGMPLWEARQKCPNIIIVPPHFDRYLTYSKITKEIYEEYTDKVQFFGLDEAWLDINGSETLFGDEITIAKKISKRIRSELGITVSMGISYNKIFAKLGSDMAKANQILLIGEDDIHKVWKLPANNLLYVGKATMAKLAGKGILTIGDLANTDPQRLRSFLGKWGITLWQYANGLDNSEVVSGDYVPKNISIGNSTTTPHDLITEQDIKITLYVLAESVAARLRESGLRCNTVSISIRYNDLYAIERQAKLDFTTCTSTTIAKRAYELFEKNTNGVPVRSLGVRAMNLVSEQEAQLSLFPEVKKDAKLQRIETNVDWLRGRYGHYIIQRAIMLNDKVLSGINPKSDHTIHPVAFM